MSSGDDRKAMVKAIYILYLVSLLTGGLTAIVGVILAHVYAEGAEEPMRSHFEYQSRTFWIGLVYAIVCTLTLPILVGVLLWGALLVWVVARCARGLRDIGDDRAVENVTTWGV